MPLLNKLHALLSGFAPLPTVAITPGRCKRAPGTFAFRSRSNPIFDRMKKGNACWHSLFSWRRRWDSLRFALRSTIRPGFVPSSAPGSGTNPFESLYTHYKKKRTYLSAHPFFCGGEGGIRTLKTI